MLVTADNHGDHLRVNCSNYELHGLFCVIFRWRSSWIKSSLCLNFNYKDWKPIRWDERCAMTASVPKIYFKLLFGLILIMDDKCSETKSIAKKICPTIHEFVNHWHQLKLRHIDSDNKDCMRATSFHGVLYRVQKRMANLCLDKRARPISNKLERQSELQAVLQTILQYVRGT